MPQAVRVNRASLTYRLYQSGIPNAIAFLIFGIAVTLILNLI